MDKDAAKSLAKSLKSKAHTFFALAPNRDHPVLVVDKRVIRAATFKERALKDAGIVVTGGAIAVGTIDRSDEPLLVVDTDGSLGRVEAKNLMLGLRKLRQQVKALKVSIPELARLKVKVGDEVVEDTTDTPDEDDTYVSPFDFPTWKVQLGHLEELAGALKLHRKDPSLDPLTPFELDEPGAVAWLGGEGRRLADTVKLAASQAATYDNDAEEVGPFRERLAKVLDLADPARVHGRAKLPPGVVHRPLDLPKDLADTEKHIRPLLEKLNAALTSTTDDTRTLDALIDQANALAQATTDRLRTIEGWIFGDKKKTKALLEVRRQAEAAAAELEKRRAAPSAKVLELLGKSGSEKVGGGTTGARFLKKGGKNAFVLKPLALDDFSDDQTYRAPGQECGASSVGDLLSKALGVPRMVTPTYAVVVPGDDGEKIATYQEAWDARGNLDDIVGIKVKVGDRPLLGLGHNVASLVAQAGLGGGAVTEIRGYMGKRAEGWTDEELLELSSKLRGLQNKEGGFDVFEDLVDLPEDLDDDLAAIALVDLFTGQRDHKQGKYDNLLAVQVDGETRLRPVDYGECMHGLDSFDLVAVDFGAWSGLPGARKAFKPKLLEAVLGLEPEDVVEAARKGMEEAAKALGEPRVGPTDHQLAALGLQIRVLKAVASAAKDRQIPVSPWLLAQAAAGPMREELELVQAAFRKKQDWKSVLEGLPATRAQRVQAFLDHVG